MKIRLILAIVGTLIDEALIAAAILWLLPLAGIHLPVYVLVVLMVALVAFGVLTYRLGSRALKKKPTAGLSSMVGTMGRVVNPLVPKGMVMIAGELWQARAENGDIEAGENIIVVSQDGLKLVVRQEQKPPV